MSAAITLTNAAGDRITGRVCEIEREAVRTVNLMTQAARRGDSFYTVDGLCADSTCEFCDDDRAALTLYMPVTAPRSTARVVMRQLKSLGWRDIATVRGDGVTITATAIIDRDEVQA
jgi:hypothetical protein